MPPNRGEATINQPEAHALVVNLKPGHPGAEKLQNLIFL